MLQQVSIAGLSKHDNGNPEELELHDTFRGIYSEQDLSAEEKRLQQVVQAGEPRGTCCYYDPSTGLRELDEIVDDCDWIAEHQLSCPVKTYHDAKKRLSCIKSRAFFPIAFLGSRFARAHGLLGDEKLIYRQA